MLKQPGKITFVTELFYPSIGGQEVRFQELAGLFAQHGWDVEVLTIASKPGLAAEENIGRVRVRRLVADHRYQRPLPGLRRNLLTIARFAWAVRRHLQAAPCDVAVFNQWPLLPQMIAPRTLPLTVNDWCEHRSGWFWKAVNSLLARSTDKHICVSEGLRQLLEARYRLDGAEAVPSGIFRDIYRPAAEKTGILFFGRLSEHKHPEDAVKAVIRARERGLQDHLTIAGGGPCLKPSRPATGISRLSTFSAASLTNKSWSCFRRIVSMSCRVSAKDSRAPSPKRWHVGRPSLPQTIRTTAAWMWSASTAAAWWSSRRRKRSPTRC